MTTRPAATRLLAGIGLAWGLALLLRPGRLVARLAPEFPAERRWLVRVLGARLVTQNAVVLAVPTGPVVRAASGVELLHAASMLPFLRSARYGRAARISGAVASATAATLPTICAQKYGRLVH